MSRRPAWAVHAPLDLVAQRRNQGVDVALGERLVDPLEQIAVGCAIWVTSCSLFTYDERGPG
jgi:hypothetical protein